MAATTTTASGQTLSPTYVNAFRISAVTSRLLSHLRGESRSDNNNSEFYNLCLALARGIDYAVSNNDIPSRAPDLPYLLNQVCQRKNDRASQAAIMVLMISVKSACSNGWFSEKAKEELYALAEEMQSSFCSVSVRDLNSNVKIKESNLHPTISTIMSRFYPVIKMGEILCLVETKPGYDSYVTDLHISKGSKTSPEDKIYLFVAQTDNTDTSSCLINPQQVNFLLNGEGVHRRTYSSRDPGPQMPTPVTHMLKYGSNLLQVVGQFNGRYLIVIGFMNVVSNPDFSTIPDYVPPVAAQPDSDNEISEGPSRISLKCPISFSRIKIPAKGHTCKHLQCFDFNNYVGINSRRPLWRCPHCSQSVCFNDIRIDQAMVKVLKEVGEDVTYVKISGDGSWEAVTENTSNEHTEKPNDASPSIQEITTQNVDDIMDLTGNDNEMDMDDGNKPSPAGESSGMHKNLASHMEDEFWGDYYSHTIGTIMTHGQGQGQGQGQSQMPQQNENSNSNGHVRYQTPATLVTSTQNAVQTLLAQHSIRMVYGDRQQNFSRTQNQGPIDNNSLLSSQRQTPPQVGTSSSSPQQISSPSMDPNQHQSLNQRLHLPVLSSGQPSPRVQLGGAYGNVGTMASVASSQSPKYPSAAIQRTTSQTMSPSATVPQTVQTSGSSSGAVAGTAEENWRPSGRMRGSLTGWQYSEAIKNQTVIHPSQPVQAARPPPVLNAPRPFIPPHLQALMGNNPRPESGGSSPGQDSSMAGGPGSDK